MEIRNVVNQTLSVTEPNVFLKDRDMEQTLLPLSLQLHFDLYKRVGKKDIRIGEEKTDYIFVGWYTDNTWTTEVTADTTFNSSFKFANSF